MKVKLQRMKNLQGRGALIIPKFPVKYTNFIKIVNYGVKEKEE